MPSKTKNSTNLQVMVLVIGVDLVARMHVEHGVQTLGGGGVLLELLHLHTGTQKGVSV